MTVTRRTRSYGSALYVVFFSLATLVNAQSPDSKPYIYPADGFQAAFPSLPEIQKKDVPTDAGPRELRSYNVQLASVVLFVGVSDYGSSTAGRDPAAMLQGAKNAALANSGSHLTGEKNISLGGAPGLEYTAQSDSTLFTARIYMRGSTIYQVIVVAPLGKPYPDAARFFDSFQLIEKTAN